MEHSADHRPTIEHDRSRCEALGVCELQASDYFEVQDEGTLQVRKTAVSTEDLDAVRSAVESCPTGALRLTNAG